MVIDQDIVVRVLSIAGSRVRLGVQAPAEMPVRRQELSPRTATAGVASGNSARRVGPIMERTVQPGGTSPPSPGPVADPWLPAPQRQGRIALAEDDDEMRAMLSQALRAEGYEVTECRDGMQLVGCLWDDTSGRVRHDVDLVISDIRMPGVLGLSVLAGVHDEGGWLPVILITAFGDAATHAEAERLGAVAILDKPFEVDDLLQKVREVRRSVTPQPWRSRPGIRGQGQGR